MKSERPIHVLIADDQVLYREGLRELMGHWPEFKVIGEASNGLEAVEFCKKVSPDIILMDVRMPLMNGIEATKLITKVRPEVIVVMLTVEADDESLFGALCNGAKGFVLKDMPSSQLRERLRGAVRGEAALSGAAATKLIDKLARQTPSRTGGGGAQKRDFSEREMQILQLVAQGLSNEEIGARLYLSSGTVKKQLRILMQKHNLDNRVQMAAYAIRLGLVD